MCVYACRDRYEGAWAAGVRCGKGACAYANGDAYQGVSRLGIWVSQYSPAWHQHHVAAKVHTLIKLFWHRTLGQAAACQDAPNSQLASCCTACGSGPFIIQRELHYVSVCIACPETSGLSCRGLGGRQTARAGRLPLRERHRLPRRVGGRRVGAVAGGAQAVPRQGPGAIARAGRATRQHHDQGTLNPGAVMRRSRGWSHSMQEG